MRRVCLVSPCGSGKTTLAAASIREAMSRGHKVIFITHRQELIDQAAETLKEFDVPFGFIAAGEKLQYGQSCQIAMVNTLKNRLNEIPAPTLIICDECHHIKAQTYLEIINRYPDAWLVGMTATLWRMGDEGFGDVFEKKVEPVTTHELIEAGYLTHYKYVAPTLVSLSETKQVRTVNGDYAAADMEGLLAKDKIVGDIVENYKKFADGKSAICYCVSVKHSTMTAKAFKRAGIRAVHIDGKTSKGRRRRYIEDFRSGKIRVLCNVDVVGEGFDVPNVHAIILARPTQSLRLYVQQSLRGLRVDPDNPDKQAIIIDHVENWKRHGLPDEDRTWSLEAPEKKVTTEIRVKQCPVCGCVVEWGTERCPYCDHLFAVLPKTSRYASTRERDVAEVAGELALLYASDEAEKAIIKLYDGFLVVALDRKYKIMWAFFKTLNYVKDIGELRRLASRAHLPFDYCERKWKAVLDRKASQ